MHRLRRFLFFDSLGRIRGQEPEVYVNQAGCLNVLTNVVVVWNTVYMQAVLERLRTQGNSGDEADFAHLSPVCYGHINPYGKFRFEISVKLAANGLRSLRLQNP